MADRMTDTESKCRRIYNLLLRLPQFADDPSTNEFKNLGTLGLRFKLKPSEVKHQLEITSWSSPEARQEYLERTKDGTDLLTHVHFDTTATEFLPNEYLYWNELEKGAYKTLVEQLLQKLETLTAAQ